ncbi:MAG: ABC transporter substrate-binding protein, partial [Paracoccus sp. (in: a-proteobacteria)]
ALLLPGTAIWTSPPEKGLVLRRDFAEARPGQTGALMRAIWRAGRWLDEPDHRGTAAEIVSRAEYLDLPSELVERGLTGRLLVSPAGEARAVPRLLAFNAGAASFPWKSLAALIARNIALRHDLPPEGAMQRAMGHFRTDLYRRHLRPAGASLPGASLRLEGMIGEDRTVAAERGQMILRADSFFDGFVFEPPIPDSSIN